MIREEKIVRYVILASLFYGLFNLVGQFGSFLPPFIFNYIIVSIIALVFCFWNRNEKEGWILYCLSAGIIGISISSGQFLYAINLYAKGKVEMQIPEWITFLSHLLIWVSIGATILSIEKDNSNKSIKAILTALFFLLITYAISLLIGFSEALYFFLALSFGLYALLNSNRFYLNKTQSRIIFILILNGSLEVLKIVSILFLPK